MSTILKKRVLRWVRGLALCALLVPTGLLAIAVLVMTTQQEHLVARLLVSVNEGIAGTVSIERSHIAPFADFPRISIDLEGVEIFEDVAHGNTRILRLDDVYLGFDLLTLLRGTPELRSLRIEGGEIALIEHTDGTLNLANALAPQASDTQVSTVRKYKSNFKIWTRMSGLSRLTDFSRHGAVCTWTLLALLGFLLQQPTTPLAFTWQQPVDELREDNASIV